MYVRRRRAVIREREVVWEMEEYHVVSGNEDPHAAAVQQDGAFAQRNAAWPAAPAAGYEQRPAHAPNGMPPKAPPPVLVPKAPQWL